MKLISESVPSVTGRIFSKKYVRLGRILTHWEAIVGDDMADKTQPIKLSYHRNKEKKTQFVLELAANSSDAMVLRYRVDLIIERINQIFGDDWIKAIKFVPVVSNERSRIKRTTRKTLTEDEKNYLSEVLKNTKDPELEEKLREFGEALLLDKEN
jgi:hypothetical protein